ncbi:TonB-dependent receptor plug domain-containing protein [Sphingobium nicotianae]|uniref:TonB-dependent receptor n=1 Tax=Sphingobium nicotianae TaxID=2782607 RepID=A0A9X1IRF6_9SPHN|nr:TonB-dependent receptor [Sphingobium nicotianae]MBT2187274.1 TonB-dependent receptor [Sphingobium nicotianae]
MPSECRAAVRTSGWLAAGLCVCGVPAPAAAQSIEELRDMPISALSDLDVTSVTKSAGTLGDAPAAIFVITHDDIVRSGNITLPGMLRLAPNLQIARGSPNDVVITARGLSGREGAQSFSNKLLVMIDGRSVYTPLYSGVYWDQQDVLPEDVDRIEVVSGPGATLWGANAVNGVINVITRNAGASQGLYATGVVGNRTYDAGLRYGGSAGDTLNYRLFVKRHQNFESGDGARDGSRRTQGGFRVDWSPGANDTLMVQGDAYHGSRGQGPASADEETEGFDLVARWDRTSASGNRLQVQTYFDHAARQIGNGSGRASVDTVDFDLQHSFALGTVHSIVWGGGARFNRYRIFGVPNLLFVPSGARQFLANLFVQDSVAITPRLTAIAGLKLEYGPYEASELLPSVRLAWKPNDSALLWAAVSRAVRSPTPFDRDVREFFPNGTLGITGMTDFRAEKLTAFEGGTRLDLTPQVSLSVSGFYNAYDDLRTVEPTPVTTLPFYWGNGIRGHTYGFDSWADIRLTDWWRVKPGYSLLISRFHFKDGSVPLISTTQVGNDPTHRASLRSSMDLGPQINFDADLRYVSALPDPFSPSYVELGARLGWQFVERAELSVSGFNLLHDRHQELPLADAKPVGRSVFVALKWTL